VAELCTNGSPEIFAPKNLRMSNRQGLKLWSPFAKEKPSDSPAC